MLCFAFPENVFNFDTQKSAKKLKNVIFKHSGHLFLTITQLQNQVLILDYYPTLDLNVFKGFARLPENSFNFVIQTFSKNRYMPFSNAQIIRFSPQGSLKTIFGLKEFALLCLTFPENVFNFITQKLEKKCKMTLSNVQNVGF